MRDSRPESPGSAVVFHDFLRLEGLVVGSGERSRPREANDRRTLTRQRACIYHAARGITG
jgi:hypothetical protein